MTEANIDNENNKDIDINENDKEVVIDENESVEEGTCKCDDSEQIDSEAKESEEDVTDDALKDDNEDKSKKFFKRKDKKKDKKDEQIEELTDKYQRLFAEFDNFRKRTEKEKSAMFEVGAKSIIEKVLPVVDNFERGILALSKEELEQPFAQGMDKVYKQLLKELDNAGVKPIEAVGKEFNPEFHNAVMHVEDENFGENEVAEEFQKGYMYRENVVRHSMVKVAN